ncbi:MAG: hypothetical protein Q7R33_06050 [Nitrosarchaeum sp.]|nr:hypothetical protein [Nitrosarchaeum sp.]
MNDTRRYHRIVEQQVDIFIDLCKKLIQQRGLESKIWVQKDEQESIVGIGDPDKLVHHKDFGFAFYYEMIISQKLEDVVAEFVFKLDHFIKLANTTNKFPKFKTNESKDTDQHKETN